MIHDIETLALVAGDARAELCPEMGANCVRLRLGDADVLRTPPDAQTYRAQPNVYGEPLLFPPNRIAGGAYSFNGRAYRFPVNEPARGHHIHGFLSATPFVLADSRADGDLAEARFVYRATAEQPYLDFPHAFTVERSYRLTATSLRNALRVVNDGDAPMPVGVGFHTTLNVCFLADRNPAHYRVTVPVAEEIALNRETILPTGERIRDNALIRALNGGGIAPLERAISDHFVRAPGEAALTHQPTGRSIRYRTSPELNFWMLWNAGAGKDFFCVEPQTWIVDAPNQSHDSRVSGFRALAPGEALTLWTELALD